MMQRGYLALFFFLTLTVTGVAFSGPVYAQESTVSPEELSVFVEYPFFGSIVRSLAGDEIKIYEGDPTTEIAIEPSGRDSVVRVALAVYTPSSTANLKYRDFYRGEIELNLESYQGIQNKDFAGWTALEAGNYLSFNNIKVMADSIKGALIELGLDRDMVESNYGNFVREIDAIDREGREYFKEIGRDRSRWLLVDESTAYILDNAGLTVGEILKNPDGTVIPAKDELDLVYQLSNNQLAGIVCPQEKKSDAVGVKASDIAARANVPVCYVKTEPGPSDTVLSQAAFNLMRLTAAVNYKTVDPVVRHEKNTVGNLVWGFVVAALVIWLIMLNKRMYYLSSMPPPVFNREPGKKKKK